jgi:hypothetical protein
LEKLAPLPKLGNKSAKPAPGTAAGATQGLKPGGQSTPNRPGTDVAQSSSAQPAEATNPSASRGTDPRAGRPAHRQIVAEVLDWRDDEQTHASLHQELVRQILQTAKELADVALTKYQAEQELIWLQKQPGVEVYRRREQKSDPLGLGTRITRRIVVSLPPEVVQEWTHRLRALAYRHYWGYLYGALATLGLWLVGLLALALVDRWTGGYRRGAILLFGGGLLLVLTAATWFSIYLAYLS